MMANKHNKSLQLPNTPSTGRQARLEITIGLLLIVLAFAVVHGPGAVDNFSLYQWEDGKFINHNRVFIHSVGDCFTERPLWGGLYRPLTTNLYYYLGRKLFYNRIEDHHAINIVLYLLNGLLLFLICRKFLPGYWAIIPPVLWVSRYAHVEVVCNSCEFQALLATFFALLSLGIFITARARKRSGLLLVSVLFFVLALLSKETSIVLAGILTGFALLFEKPAAWKHYLWHPAVAVVWVFLFVTVFKGVTENQTTGFIYNFSLANLSMNLAAYLLSFSYLLTHSLDSVIMVSGVASLAQNWLIRLVVLGMGFTVGAYTLLQNRLKGYQSTTIRVIAFGLVIFFCAAAPHVILERRMFMRYGYFPHAGLALAAGVILRELFLRIRDCLTRRGWVGRR